jgi:peptide/nickel transport system ATP-binding protein
MTPPAHGETVVDISDLYVSFASDQGAVKAVDGVSIEVSRGEVVAVVGESGSGKTVTAKTILGLLPETATTSGVVMLSGRHGGQANDVVSVSRQRLQELRGSDVAMVFQEPSTALNPVYTVGWQIAEGLRAHTSMSRRETRAKAIDILRKVGIPDPETRVDYYPHQLSGGQKQRVVIARALVNEPDLIFADEPTGNLDTATGHQVEDLLFGLQRERGITLVVVTHDEELAARCDRRITIADGLIVGESDAAASVISEGAGR